MREQRKDSKEKGLRKVQPERSKCWSLVSRGSAARNPEQGIERSHREGRRGDWWLKGTIGINWDGLERVIGSCVGNGSADRKGLIRAVIIQKKGKGQIWQLLEPGESRQRRCFRVAWVNGKCIFHRVRAGFDLWRKKNSSSFCWNQMCVSGVDGNRRREVHLHD